MGEHLDRLFGRTNARLSLTPFSPLSWHEFQTLTQNLDLKQMPEDVGERLWLLPVQRLLQWRFRIDQDNYTTTTDPTLAELTEDFKVCTAITIDKMFLNSEDLYGVQDIEGSSHRWNHNLPQRVLAIMERYERSGGRIGRS